MKKEMKKDVIKTQRNFFKGFFQLSWIKKIFLVTSVILLITGLILLFISTFDKTTLMGGVKTSEESQRLYNQEIGFFWIGLVLLIISMIIIFRMVLLKVKSKQK